MSANKEARALKGDILCLFSGSSFNVCLLPVTEVTHCSIILTVAVTDQIDYILVINYHSYVMLQSALPTKVIHPHQHDHINIGSESLIYLSL